MISKQTINEIAEILAQTGFVERVILFGSFAVGKANDDSDVDLYVVTADDYMPSTHKERSQLYLKVSRVVRKFKMLYPIDLVVHSRKMYQQFAESRSAFSREILGEGVVLYGA